MTKLLFVKSPHISAGAVFSSSPWRCVKAAPILQWMVGKSPDEAVAWVEKHNWEYLWVGEVLGPPKEVECV